MVVAAAGIAVSAASTIASSSMAASATEDAANKAAQAQANTLSFQQQQLQAQIQMQQQSLNQQMQLSAPYRSLGQSAIPQLEGLLGIQPQSVPNSAVPYQQSQGVPGAPGYQAPQQGMGGLGGAGMPIAGGGNPTLTGGLGAASGGAGSIPPYMQGQIPGQAPTMPAPGAQNQTPGQTMFNPPATSTGGVPSYGNVLQGYSNILGQLEGAVGLGGGGAGGGAGQNGVPNTQAMTDALRNSPGYQFQLEEANSNAKNQAAAQGMSLSGNTLQSLSGIGQGLADSTYQQYLGNIGNTLGAYQGYVGDYQNYLGQLMNSVTLGQGAAANQAANIGNSASAVGAAYTNTGNAIAGANNQLGNIAMNQGNTQAGIYANEIAGLTKTAGNAMNNYQTQNTLNALNNPNGQSMYGGASGGWSSDPAEYGYAMPTDYGGGFPG